MLTTQRPGYEVLDGARRSFAADSFSALTPTFLLQGMLESFDIVGAGLCILDGEGKLLHRNDVAAAILAERDGLELTPGRTLRAGGLRGSSPRGLLEQLQDGDAFSAGEEEPRAILAVPRPSGKRPFTLLARFSDPLPHLKGSRYGYTLVFIVDPEASREGMKAHVREAYGLTGAETELAILLVQGNHLSECCRKMTIRRSTAASHLRQLFKKTQARTQSQLVSMLFRRFALLGADCHTRLSRAAYSPKVASPLAGASVDLSEELFESLIHWEVDSY